VRASLASIWQSACWKRQAVVGLDNLNDYYDPALKLARLGASQTYRDLYF
jgi:hypothetical protein